MEGCSSWTPSCLEGYSISTRKSIQAALSLFLTAANADARAKPEGCPRLLRAYALPRSRARPPPDDSPSTRSIMVPTCDYQHHNHAGNMKHGKASTLQVRAAVDTLSTFEDRKSCSQTPRHSLLDDAIGTVLCAFRHL